MAVLQVRKKSQYKFLTTNNTLTSGITKSNPILPIVSAYRQWGNPETHDYVSELDINSLIFSLGGNQDIAGGEHVATFPLGLIQPLWGKVMFTALCTTGTQSGEVGLGTTIASGNVKTLGGTVAFGNIMDGTTAGVFEAATSTSVPLANLPDLTGTKATHGVLVFDGSATAKKIHLNFAVDADANENLTFSAKVRFGWRWLGTGLTTD